MKYVDSNIFRIFIIYWDDSENRRERRGTQRKITHPCASLRPLR